MADHIPPPIPSNGWKWCEAYFESEDFMKDFLRARLYERKLVRDWAELNHDHEFKRDAGNIIYYLNHVPKDGATAPHGSDAWLIWHWKWYYDILIQCRLVMDRKGIEEPWFE